jgi:hypothetical protein
MKNEMFIKYIGYRKEFGLFKGDITKFGERG